MKIRHILTAVTAAAALSLGVHQAEAASQKLEIPDITCVSATDLTITINLTAPNTDQGGRAGLSVQWMTLADYVANGEQWFSSSDPRLCKASLSGNANGSDWSFAPNETKTIEIGNLNDADPGVSYSCNILECDTDYVIRAFFHQVPKGKFGQGQSKTYFSNTLICNTAAESCAQANECQAHTYSQGGIFGPNAPASGCFPITVGGVTYNDQASANAVPAGLRQQVLALALNICINGGAEDCYAQTIVCDLSGSAFNGLALTDAQKAALEGATINEIYEALSAYLTNAAPLPLDGPYGLKNANATNNRDAGGQMANLASSLNKLYEGGVLATGFTVRVCNIPPVP